MSRRQIIQPVRRPIRRLTQVRCSAVCDSHQAAVSEMVMLRNDTDGESQLGASVVRKNACMPDALDRPRAERRRRCDDRID